MSIIIHKNLDRVLDEKDIRIEFLKNIKDNLDTLEFSIPKKIPCKMSNSNYTYLANYSIKFDSRITDKVFIDTNDIDFMFDNFSLATKFILNRYLKTVTSLNNRWDGQNKIMYVDC